MIINVNKDIEGKEIKEFLNSLDFSSSELRRLKKCDGIKVNGSSVTVRYVLKEKDVLSLNTEDTASSETIEPKNIPLNIIYEDEDICIINKPKDMPVHPSQNHRNDTLANALAYKYQNKNFVFRAITRLDRNTTGITLIAKNRISASFLSREMKEGRIEKEYLAVLDGTLPEKNGVIDKKIGRKEGSIIERCISEKGEAAKTIYTVISENDARTLVKARTETGRTHQIRVHFAYMNCPLTGDSLYGKENPLISGQVLHAYTLTFTHPTTRIRLKFKADIPNEFKKLTEEFKLPLSY